MLPQPDSTVLPHVPAFAEDETCYSWCCRWHRLTLNRTRSSGMALFGIPSAAKIWTAPNPFGKFDLVTKGALGSPLNILRERTVLGSYLPLARPLERVAVARGERPPSRLLSEKSGLLMTLRYCEHCARRHQEIFGVAIWRVDHQLPGAAVCIDHGSPLFELDSKRQLWLLPGGSQGTRISVATPQEFDGLMMVSITARKIFECDELEVTALVRKARLVVTSAYGVVDAKRLDPERVANDWRKSALASWCKRERPEMMAFPDVWIVDLLRGRRSERSPLRWAFLLAYFNERDWTSPETFLKGCVESHDSQLSLWADLEKIPIDVQHAFSANNSAAQAAAAIGVSVTTVRRWVRTYPGLAWLGTHWGRKR